MRKLVVEFRDKTYKGKGRFSEVYRLNTLFCEFAFDPNEGESKDDFAKRVIDAEKNGGRAAEYLNMRGLDVFSLWVEEAYPESARLFVKKRAHGELTALGFR